MDIEMLPPEVLRSIFSQQCGVLVPANEGSVCEAQQAPADKTTRGAAQCAVGLHVEDAKLWRTDQVMG